MSGFLPSLFSDKNGGAVIFREIFFKSPVGMCVLTHPDFEIKLVNDSFAKVFSLDKSKITGELFAVVWEKSKARDDFFTGLIKKGYVDNFMLLREISGGDKREIMLSAVFIDSDDILITAAIRPD